MLKMAEQYLDEGLRLIPSTLLVYQEASVGKS
jgi:hypothetical protein